MLNVSHLYVSGGKNGQNENLHSMNLQFLEKKETHIFVYNNITKKYDILKRFEYLRNISRDKWEDYGQIGDPYIYPEQDNVHYNICGVNSFNDNMLQLQLKMELVE